MHQFGAKVLPGIFMGNALNAEATIDDDRNEDGEKSLSDPWIRVTDPRCSTILHQKDVCSRQTDEETDFSRRRA